ncbi:MAG: cbb3-type cytochrome c oxidase subunit I [Rhodospirillales bacterium]|nr:cbb3-type cytochrome c oxidase subunit I [Rhodospirillales bacterium]
MPDNGASLAPRAGFRRELTGWAVLAVGALGIAGVFAFLLALSRVPGIEAVFPWPVGFFHKGLVIHVVFSFVVWFLAVFGALTLIVRERLAPGRLPVDSLGKAALAGGFAALPLLFVPALLDRGEPTLNNYVPVIIDPLYYCGLAVLALAVGCTAVRLLLVVRLRLLRRDPPCAAVASAALVYLIALACFAVALSTLAGSAFSFDFNERLMWGGGHALQFVNALMLVAAWAALSAPYVRSVPTTATSAANTLLVLAAAVLPVFYLALPMFSHEQTAAFTWMQYAFGPAAAIMAAGVLNRLARPWPWREPAFLALALSLLLFGIGGGLGLFVDGTDTRTPAHYHGVIAGITLAFFGLFYARILPLLGRPRVSALRMRLILHLFAWGQLAASIGLFIAGGHGAPRKVAGDAQGLSDTAQIAGMALNGLGGLIAIIGGILFVWTMAAVFLRASSMTNHTALPAEIRL